MSSSIRGWGAWAARRWRAVRATPDRGYNIVEAAIILPVIIVLTMTVVQFALVWHGRHIAQAAAADAARSAAGYQSTAGRGQSDAAGFLQSVAPHLLTGATVTVARGAQQVTTTVHADVLSVIPFGSFAVDEHAAAPIEQFQQ